jgi:hypothetical protein
MGIKMAGNVGSKLLTENLDMLKEKKKFEQFSAIHEVPQPIKDAVNKSKEWKAANELMEKGAMAEAFKTPEQKGIAASELAKTESETWKNLNPSVTNVVIPGYTTPGGNPAVIPSRGAPIVTPLKGMTPKPANQTPPPGYRYTETGSLETIPGGPAFTQAEEAKTKAQAAADSQKQEAELVINKIDSALKNVSNLSAGYGATTKNVPGSPAMNLSADLDTIQSSLGLNKLMEMKANSKAGASGMGQLSDREMTLLTSAIASLRQAQSPKQLKAKLNEVKTHYQNILKMGVGINPYENKSSRPLLTPAQSEASPKPGGVLHVDTKGAKAWVYPDGTFDEVR